MDWKELENETTENLVEFIKTKKEEGYEELAEAAFHALTFRFRSDVLDKCVVSCRKWKMDESDAAEVANRTFERLWKYPKFDIGKCRYKNYDLCLRLYLYGIIKKELASYYRAEIDGIEIPYNGDEEIVTTISDIPDTSIEKKSELQLAESNIDKALSTLTQKHKVIYLTYLVHEKKGHKLPRHLTEKLRDTLNLTQNSIRVYKKDAFEAIRKYLENVQK